MNTCETDSINFSSLSLSAPILKAVSEKGYKTLFPIQAKAIPLVLEGKDGNFQGS